MKRPSSPSSDHESDTKPYVDELSDSNSPSPLRTKKFKTKITPTKAKSPSEQESSAKVKFDPEGEKMVWDADGREALMDHLIAQGIKGIDKAVLAEKFGVTKQKIHNELSLGRNGNMRSKATKAVRD